MSDYNFLMEMRLSPEQLRAVNYLSRVATSLGLNLYLVGGAVRDLIYGQAPIRDLDFAVDGSVERMLRRLESPPSGKSRLKLPFEPAEDPVPLKASRVSLRQGQLTAEVTFDNEVGAELNRTHSAIYRRAGGPPEISEAGIFEDLKRRDFSADAMAVSLHPNSRGLLLDPTNGVADVERRELRALYSRSFLDDPSRIYRLVRLALRLDLKPEERTKLWMESAIEAKAWQGLTPDQQGRELRGIFREENPSRVLKALAARGLLPGLDSSLHEKRIPYDRLDHLRHVVHHGPGRDPFLLYLYCFTEKVAPAHRHRLLHKILRDAKREREVLTLDREAKNLARQLGGSKASLPSQAYRTLASAPRPLVLFLLAFYPQAKVQASVKFFLFKAPQVRARLPRAELSSLGVEPGPEFEKVLEQIFLEQLDGKTKSPSQISRRLRELAGVKEPEAPKPASSARKKNGRAASKTQRGSRGKDRKR